MKKLSDRFVEYTHVSQTSYMLILAVIIGIIGGFGAIGFRWLIGIFQLLAIGSTDNVLTPLEGMAWYLKIIMPVCGAVIVGPLIYFFAREAKGHGVPEVMQAVALKNAVIRPRVVIVKSIASAITIATGGSVGREGPIVQIGSAIASTFGQWLKVSPNRLKILVGCGAAAGIAATFNAPIAGAFFALEVIIGNFALSSFSPIIISSVIATAISRALLDNQPAFIVSKYSLESIFEIPLYVVLGFICALVALLFSTVINKSEKLFEKIPVPDYLKNPLGGLLIGIIIIYFPNVYGVGYETIDLSLSGSLVWHMALLLIVIKLVATGITLGSGGSGGIFAPSLFLGAVTGSAFGKLVHTLFPDWTAHSGAYAMVGMGAVVAGATHAPITSILILFELTNDYKIILPVMIACTIATIIAKRWREDSIYTQKLSARGITLDQGHEELIMKSFSVGDLMDLYAPSIIENTNLKDIINMFMKDQEPFYYVVTEDCHLVGLLPTHFIKNILSSDEELEHLVIAKDLVDSGGEPVTPDTTLAECMHRFELVESEHLPVIEGNGSRRLMGSISKKEIIKLYNREILRKDVLGVKYVRELGSEKQRNLVQLPGDYKVEFVTAPINFIGKTIRELDIRSNYNVTILAVKKKQGDFASTNEIPDPERIFTAGDILVVAGKQECVENISKITMK